MESTFTQVQTGSSVLRYTSTTLVGILLIILVYFSLSRILHARFLLELLQARFKDLCSCSTTDGKRVYVTKSMLVFILETRQNSKLSPRK